jgi:hypothetical protein
LRTPAHGAARKAGASARIVQAGRLLTRRATQPTGAEVRSFRRRWPVESQIAAEQPGRTGVESLRPMRRPQGFPLMTNFGYHPGILDYWMLLADWRNGSFAILLALGVLLVGYALATRPLAPAPPEDILPIHASPIISDGAVDEVVPPGRPAITVSEEC